MKTFTRIVIRKDTAYYGATSDSRHSSWMWFSHAYGYRRGVVSIENGTPDGSVFLCGQGVEWRLV